MLANFAFDEVLRESTLDTRMRLIVQLSAIIASQALGAQFGGPSFYAGRIIGGRSVAVALRESDADFNNEFHGCP